MKSVSALTLLWSINNAANKGTFLAAVEGFSARGLTRPWDHSNNKRVAGDQRKKKHNSPLIRNYVNHELEGDSENDSNMRNTTQVFSSDANEALGFSTTSSSNSSVLMTAAATSREPLSHGYHRGHSLQGPVTNTPIPTVKACLPDLLAMTRPINIPAVVIFHMLGAYLAVQNSAVSIWSVLLSPSMIVTMVALLLPPPVCW